MPSTELRIESVSSDDRHFRASTVKNGIARRSRTLASPMILISSRRPTKLYLRARNEVVNNDEALYDRGCSSQSDHPVLIDHFLQGAVELDVDCVCDGEDVTAVPRSMSGRPASIVVIPPWPTYSVPMSIVDEVPQQTAAMVPELSHRPHESTCRTLWNRPA